MRTMAYSSGVFGWVPLGDYMQFSSSATRIVSVGSVGLLTLHNNTDSSETVEVSAGSRSGDVSDSVSVFCNLEAEALDLDLGSRSGGALDVGSLGVDSEFTLSVRMNTGGEVLTGFQLVLAFDSSVVQVISASAGGRLAVQRGGDDWRPGVRGATFGVYAVVAGERSRRGARCGGVPGGE